MAKILDFYPEHMDWEDTGCDLHPACLTCPFPVCRHDTENGMHAYLRGAQALEMTRLRTLGKSAKDIAAKFGVTERSVHRALSGVGS